MPAPTLPGDHQPPVTPTPDIIVEKKLFELPSYSIRPAGTALRMGC
jgi:hypothetical protein